jgi:hypothetical protein
LFKGPKLVAKSEALIYFVTHIVLVATMWGECDLITKETHDWKPVSNCLWSWVKLLQSSKQWNLEVWLEVLVCLHFVGESILAYVAETTALFSHMDDFKDVHSIYHTHILWLYYFHAAKSNRNKSSL